MEASRANKCISKIRTILRICIFVEIFNKQFDCIYNKQERMRENHYAGKWECFYSVITKMRRNLLQK